MRKKIIYGIIFSVVVILGYFNYYADEENLTLLNQSIETTNVVYKNDNYEVEAKKQKDFIEKKETEFNKARAKVNEMLLTGDNVLLDKVRNLVLKNNIFGVSQNGWTFKTESAKYNKLTDEITSDTGVVAENSKRKIKISGKNFLTNSKMTFVKLTNDVVLENDNLGLKGDKGLYNDNTKIVELSDNITLFGIGKNSGLIGGKFKSLTYNSEKKILESFEPFEIDYKGLNLSAENLYFNDGNEELKITKNIILKVSDFKINCTKIEKNKNSNIIKIYGKITGTNGVYSFVAPRGEYNTESKIFTLFGNIYGTSTKGEKLKGEKLIYYQQKNLMEIIGDGKEIYSSKDGSLFTRKINYNTETKVLTTDERYSFIGNRFESKGEKLYYNELTKDVEITNGYILDKVKKQTVKGNYLCFNTITEDTKLKGNAELKDDKMKLLSEMLDYNGRDKIATILEKYEVKIFKDGTTIKGENAKYNRETGDFISRGDIFIIGDSYTVKGKNLTYNDKSGLGKLEDKVVLNGKQDNLNIVGGSCSFKNGEYVEIIGNLDITSDKIIAKSAKGVYNLKDKKIYIPEDVDFKTVDGETTGSLSNGVYNLKNDIFSGDKFNAISEDKVTKVKKFFTSDKASYDTKHQKMIFSQNVVIKDNTYTFNGEKAEYYFETDMIKALNSYTMKYGEFIFFGNYGNFDNKNKIFSGNEAKIINQVGDEFISDKVYGNLNEMILDFNGNVKGKANNKGSIIEFSGEKARIYFKKNEKYEMLRGEVRNNAMFKEADKILYSDYIEINMEKKLVFSKEGSKLVLTDEKNGETIITAQSVDIDTLNKNIILRGSVTINNNSEYGNTYVIADRGELEEKKEVLILTGNVKIENETSILKTDKAFYNIDSRKIKAVGNVFVEYKK